MSLTTDIARIASGTALSQVLAIAAAPLLTRLFLPAAFGQYALFVSTVAIVTVIACGRYELAINLPGEDKEAANVLGLALVSGLASSLVAGLLLLAAASLGLLQDWASLVPMPWLLPPTVFFAATALALTYWTSRTKRFGRLGVAHVAAAVTTLGWQLGAGLSGHTSAEVLIMGTAGGHMVSAAVLGAAVLASDRTMLGAIDVRGVRAAAVRYRRFPAYSLPSALMNNLSWQTPVFLLSTLFAPAVAGLYSISHRLLRLPIHLLGRSLSQVFYQRASVAAREGTLAPLVERMLRGLMALTLLPSVLLTLVGRDLFVVAFGEPWAEAGVFVQILSPWTFVWLVSSPLSTIFSALERQSFDLNLNIVILSSRIVALMLGAYLGGPRLALALFAVSGVIVYGYLIFAIASAATLPARRVWALAGGELARTLPLAVPVVLAMMAGLSTLVILGVAGLAGAVHAARTGAEAYRMAYRHG